MVKAGLREGSLDRHSEIDRVNNGKYRLTDDRRPTGSPDRQNWLAILKNNGRAHARERTLSGSHRIGFRTEQAEVIGDSGFNGEVIHLVVQTDASPGYDALGAK